MIAGAQTAFLLTSTPDGVADVSHRGGDPGFLRYSKDTHSLNWTEYLGDGMFVSMGNARSNSNCALAVLEFRTGHALLLHLELSYTNIRSDRHERVDALLQADASHPVQGAVKAIVQHAERLEHFCHPRELVLRKSAITSCDSTAVQHPQ